MVTEKSIMNCERRTGIVTRYLPDKNYGFIRASDEDIFFLDSCLRNISNSDNLDNAKVNYSVRASTRHQGKLEAYDIVLVANQEKHNGSNEYGTNASHETGEREFTLSHERRTGIVTRYLPDKNFGFIRASDSDIFFLKSYLQDPSSEDNLDNAKVNYSVRASTRHRGKFEAYDIALVDRQQVTCVTNCDSDTAMTWKTLDSLIITEPDGEAYAKNGKKEFFRSIFLADAVLTDICDEDCYFVIGEKGTGKTAYAVYLSNNEMNGIYSTKVFVRETNYHKFVKMKTMHKLVLSNYIDIWKSILCTLIAEGIEPCLKKEIFSNKYKILKDLIAKFQALSSTPEIEHIIELTENVGYSAELSASIKALAANINGQSQSTERVVHTRYQDSVTSLLTSYIEVLESVHLSKSFTLFIDGIDLPRSDYDFESYIECIKGLANAVWELNQDIFANFSNGDNKRIKVVLLIRPDIFTLLGLHNANAKLRSNSVVLNWITRTDGYRTSRLFNLIDKMFSQQQVIDQKKLTVGQSWDHYLFRCNTKESFLELLDFSFHRPRDLLCLIDIVRTESLQRDKDANVITYDDMKRSFRNIADYLLGEIRDHLLFYFSQEQYETFLIFFQFLAKMRFDYRHFSNAYEAYRKRLNQLQKKVPPNCVTADEMLQILYEVNIIGYKDTGLSMNWYHWSYKERTVNNMNPQIRLYANYMIHSGVSRSLNLGVPYVSSV